MRTCGECTMCCKLLGVEELEKPPGQWCNYCAIGTGCKCYGSRPQTCREFECLWLQNQAMPDSMRPDQSRVVLDVTTDGGRITAHIDPSRPGAHLRGDVGRILAGLARDGHVIIVVTGNRRTLMGNSREKLVQIIQEAKNALPPVNTET